MPRLTTLTLWFIAAILCGSLFAANTQPTIQSFSKMPLAFTKNMGQWDDRVLFRANAGGATMWFTKEGVTYQFTRRIDTGTETSSGHSRESGNPDNFGSGHSSESRNPDNFGSGHSSESWNPDNVGSGHSRESGNPDNVGSGHSREGGNPGSLGGPPFAHGRDFDHSRDSTEQLILTARFVGANPNPEVVTEEQMEYKCNYFLGNDPTKWHTDVPNYEAITLKDIYPGIDLRYSGDGNGQATYEFIVAPGADAAKIKVEYEGAEETSVNSDGRMILKTKWGDLVAGIKTPTNGGSVRNWLFFAGVGRDGRF